MSDIDKLIQQSHQQDQAIYEAINQIQQGETIMIDDQELYRQCNELVREFHDLDIAPNTLKSILSDWLFNSALSASAYAKIFRVGYFAAKEYFDSDSLLTPGTFPRIGHSMHIKCKLKLAEYNEWYLKTQEQKSIIEETDTFVITDEDTNGYYHIQEDNRIAPISVWIPKKFVEIVEE